MLHLVQLFHHFKLISFFFFLVFHTNNNSICLSLCLKKAWPGAIKQEQKKKKKQELRISIFNKCQEIMRIITCYQHDVTKCPVKSESEAAILYITFGLALVSRLVFSLELSKQF